MSRTIVITGASRGIGREIAKQFARQGDFVAGFYHRNEAAASSLLQEWEQECRQGTGLGGIRLYQVDIRQAEQVKSAFQSIRKECGQVDVLVNNAGAAWFGLLTDMTEEEWNVLFDTNVKGVFHCCQAVIPDMVRRQEGCIINVSSMWGQVGASCEAAYSASKAAVIGLTRSLAKELGPSGIRVNCVAPGVIQTDMVNNLDADALDALAEETPLGRLGSPADVAGAVRFLASREAAFFTGQVLAPNGGFVV